MLIFSFFTTCWVKNIMVSKSSCTNVEETGTSQRRNSNSFRNNKSPSSTTRWTHYECTWGENCVQIQQSHNACSCCVFNFMPSFHVLSCYFYVLLSLVAVPMVWMLRNFMTQLCELWEVMAETVLWVMRGHGKNCAEAV